MPPHLAAVTTPLTTGKLCVVALLGVSNYTSLSFSIQGDWFPIFFTAPTTDERYTHRSPSTWPRDASTCSTFTRWPGFQVQNWLLFPM